MAATDHQHGKHSARFFLLFSLLFWCATAFSGGLIFRSSVAMIPNKSQTSFAKLPQNLNAHGYVHWKTAEALRMNTGEDDVEKLRKKAKELKDQAEKFRLEADQEAQELRNRDVQPKASSTENEPANSPKILTEGDSPTSSESISMEEKKPLNPISRLIEERRAENDKTEELWGKKKLGDDNAQLMEDMMDPERAFFDRYFPTPLALPAAELEAALRAEVFGPDSAFCVVDKSRPPAFGGGGGGGGGAKAFPGALLLRGVCRPGLTADQVSAVVQEKLALSSLAGRVRLTMMKEPGELDTEALMKMTPEQGQIFQKSLNDPVFVAESCTTRNWPDFLSGLLILGFILAEAGSMAVFSTFPLMMLTGGSPGKFAQLDSLPPYSPDIFQTLLFFQAVIFSTRQIVAQLTGTTLGFPYWIPSAALGGVGSWQSFRKPPKTSRALFDMAMIPTTVGFLGSISLLVTGLLSTASASQEVLRSFPLVPATVLERSLVSGALAELLAPAYVGLPDAAAAQIYLAPAAVVGLVGLYMSAVSMIPLGRTEGARAIRAAWGLRAADLTDFVCVILAVKIFQHIQKAGYLVLKLFGGTRTQSECVELMTSHIILHGPAVAEVNFLSGKVFQLDPKKMKFRDRWPACILFEDFVCVLQVLKSPIFRVGLKCNRVFLKINPSPMGDTDVFLDKPIGKQFFEEVASSTINNYRRIRNDPDFWFGKIFSGKSMRDGMFQYMLENGIPQIAVAYYMNHFYDGNGCIPGKSSNMEHYIMDPSKHEVRQRLALFVSMGPMPYPKDDKTFAKLLKQAMSSARPGVPANGILNPGLTFFFGGDITIPFWYIVLLSITDIQQGLQKGQALGAQDPLPQNMLAAADDAGRRVLHAASLLLAVAVFLPYSSGGYNF